jgi:hypothetical protein
MSASKLMRKKPPPLGDRPPAGSRHRAAHRNDGVGLKCFVLGPRKTNNLRPTSAVRCLVSESQTVRISNTAEHLSLDWALSYLPSPNSSGTFSPPPSLENVRSTALQNHKVSTGEPRCADGIWRRIAAVAIEVTIVKTTASGACNLVSG